MDVREQATRLRAEIERIKSTGGKPEFPPALRAEVVAWYHARRAEGRAAPGLYEALGLSSTTLRRWSAAAPAVPTPAAAPGFIALALPAPAPPPAAPTSPLRVVGPRGLRIEGLDVGTLADLIRRLA